MEIEALYYKLAASLEDSETKTLSKTLAKVELEALFQLMAEKFKQIEAETIGDTLAKV